MRLPATHSRLSKSLVFLSGIVFTTIIWAFDYFLLGPVIIFSLVYLIPIAWVTWFSGRRNGIVLSLASAAGWFTVYSTQNPYFTHSLLTYLNVATKLLLYLGFAYVLSGLHRSLNRERAHARTDPLTGIANRRSFLDLLAKEIRRSSRDRRPLAVAFFDIDNFKTVNDAFGHAAGDRLLRRTAGTIHKHLRMTDAIGRMGGDEFAILLPGADAPGALTVIGKIRRLLLDMTRGNGWPATFSFGVFVCSDAEHSPEEMIALADRAMYAAKQSGKNGIQLEECVPAETAAAAREK